MSPDGIKSLFLTVLLMTENISTTFGIKKEVTRRKVCVKFEINPGRAEYGYLERLDKSSMSKCALACASNAECWALNYNKKTGQCELLPAIPQCHRPGPQEGFVFRHFVSCEDKKPLYWGSEEEDVTIRNSDTLQWVLENTTLIGYKLLADVTDPVLVFHAGIYLPGTYTTATGNAAFVVDDHSPVITCVGKRYLLAVKLDYTAQIWQTFTKTEPVPANAVQVGVYFGGLPMYLLVATLSPGDIPFATYCVPADGGTSSPIYTSALKDLSILVEN